MRILQRKLRSYAETAFWFAYRLFPSPLDEVRPFRILDTVDDSLFILQGGGINTAVEAVAERNISRLGPSF